MRVRVESEKLREAYSGSPGRCNPRFSSGTGRRLLAGRGEPEHDEDLLPGG
jgi:hypothetical protein